MYCKKVLGVDIIKEVAEEASEKVKESIPTVTDAEICKIESAGTLHALSGAISSTVFEHWKEMCSNCYSFDIEKIEWQPEFEKLLPSKDIFNRKIYKCKNCGNIFLKYSWS